MIDRKEYMKEWHKKNPKYNKEWLKAHPGYAKKWLKAHPGYDKNWKANHRVQYQLAHRQGVISYRIKHPERTKATRAVERAIKKGTLIRQPCRICGNPNSQAHHSRYDRPLDIDWLCDQHHKELHKQMEENKCENF